MNAPSESVLSMLESLRPELASSGLSVEITTRPHRHGFTVYQVHVNEAVREMSDPGEVVEYLHGLRDGAKFSGSDALSQLEAAVRKARAGKK